MDKRKQRVPKEILRDFKGYTIAAVNYSEVEQIGQTKFSLYDLQWYPQVLCFHSNVNEGQEKFSRCESQILFAISAYDDAENISLCSEVGKSVGENGFAVFITYIINRGLMDMSKIYDTYDHIIFVRDPSVPLGDVAKWLITAFNHSAIEETDYAKVLRMLSNNKESTFDKLIFISAGYITCGRLEPIVSSILYPTGKSRSYDMLLGIQGADDLFLDGTGWVADTVKSIVPDDSSIYVTATENDDDKDSTCTVSLLQAVKAHKKGSMLDKLTARFTNDI